MGGKKHFLGDSGRKAAIPAEQQLSWPDVVIKFLLVISLIYHSLMIDASDTVVDLEICIRDG